MTWLAILEHFDAAKRILLTATPTRRDGKRVPGELIYHFPLRQALDEGIFKSVEPRILEIGPQEERVDIDSRLADETIRVLDEAAHSSSAALVRGSSVSRVRELAVLYESKGLPTAVLHSGLGKTKQEEVISGLRSGEYRAVAIVGMLTEGFDLPRIRALAYHDNTSRSLPQHSS